MTNLGCLLNGHIVKEAGSPNWCINCNEQVVCINEEGHALFSCKWADATTHKTFGDDHCVMRTIYPQDLK